MLTLVNVFYLEALELVFIHIYSLIITVIDSYLLMISSQKKERVKQESVGERDNERKERNRAAEREMKRGRERERL